MLLHEPAFPHVEHAATPWLYLALGAATAPVFLLHGTLRFVAWFLSALVHEMGHCAVGWLFGMPSIPAIRLDGHAVALHGPQLVFLVLLNAGLIGFALWNASIKRRGRPAYALPGVFVALYLAIALTPAREACFLLAGHAGEALFASVCLWRTMVGGWTASRLERVLYGTLGCYLVGSNVLLSAGLVLDAGARAAYAANGSFGLTNDYLRLSRDLGVPLEWIGAATGSGFAVLASFTILMVWVRRERLTGAFVREAR